MNTLNPKPEAKVVFVQAFARAFTECWEKNFGIRVSRIRISVFGLAVLFLLLFAITGARAADASQRGRFLLVFETSPVLEKNLPKLRQALGRLFSSNLQDELHAGDDVAVWTVDRELHPGVFGTENWSLGDAAKYTEWLANFLKDQNFTRHASLDAIQPTLNRVVKHSERLTILIFCDTKSRLPGTPYDSGVNDIITNTAAKSDRSIPLILVLRSYRGEYIGASVNRFESLDFPKFPPPPKPAPPPPAKPVTIPAPVTPSLPPLIIVGTNAGTSVDELAKPAPMPTPATNAMTPMPSASMPSATPVQPSNSAPTQVSTTSSEPLPAPTPVPQETPSPAQTAVSTPPVAPGNPPVVQSPNVVTSASKDSAAEPPAADAASRWHWFVGGAVGVVAAGLVVWLVTRTRRPRSSLITNSMQDDPRFPPRK